MTTNQTIDGVPRKLLENCANYTEGSASYEVLLWHKELRALLEAPARTPLLGGGALEEQPEWAQIQILKNTVADLQGDIEKLQADLAAQPQGEPVYMVRTHGSCCWEEMQGESLEMCQSQPGEYEVRKLYAEQPAPASVALPVDPERERLMEIVQQYPNVDPLKYDAAVRTLRK